MSRVINVLPKEVYNKIAAGEVVDRPASIVKELVENAIDADATSISIYISNGGIDSIAVVDNGHGIASDQLHKALLPHATSKLIDITDLEQLDTLGFRGEALASISAVASVRLVTRTQGQDIASFIQYDDGLCSEQGQVGSSFGTSVHISKLFDNIPARKKYIKRASTEQGYITAVIEKLILSRPDIAFKYLSNNRIIYQSGATGLMDAIYSVYGKEFCDNIVPVSVDGDIRVRGYVGRLGYSRHNSLQQVLTINGRYVVDSAISKTIYNCFSQYLVSRQYPVFVLHISMDTQSIDVNAHPNKLEVRLYNKDRVCSAVARACRQAIDATSSDSIFDFDKRNAVIAVHNTESDSASDQVDKSIVRFARTLAGDNMRESRMLSGIISSDQKFASASMPYTSPKSNRITQSDDTENIAVHGAHETLMRDEGSDWTRAVLVGSLFDTYIVLQGVEHVYFVDQHAAHEKLIYDQLCKEIQQGDIVKQDLLVPFTVTLDCLEKELLMDNFLALQEIGFELREYGISTIAISSVPHICSDINLGTFVSQILLLLKDGRKINRTTPLTEQLQMIACKAAVKGGKYLYATQITALLRQFEESDSELFCPHGRPIVHAISKDDMERWFKRGM